jgi:hypothetical protein
MKKNILFYLFICTVFLFIYCNKESNKFDIIGTWETELLTINGIDTTSHLRVDTNCYGYLRFFIDDGTEYITIEPAKGNFNGFYCSQHGHWFILGKAITIDFVNASSNILGPYLLDERIKWNILEKSNSYLKLQVVWNGNEFNWNLKKLY